MAKIVPDHDIKGLAIAARAVWFLVVTAGRAILRTVDDPYKTSAEVQVKIEELGKELNKHW